MGRRNREGRGGGHKLSEREARAIARARGLQREIARRHGVSHQHVSHIKRGRRWDYVSVRMRIARGLRFVAKGLRILALRFRSLIGRGASKG